MPMRIQEIHPSLVHYPLALIPAALVADAAGFATGNRKLMEMGRTLMPWGAGSAAFAAVAGLAAYSAAKFDTRSRSMALTHGNLNLGLVGVLGAMTAWRVTRRAPTPAYLLLGFAGLAATTYSAYLGGHMVYEHGVGVAKAGGLKEHRAPQLVPSQFGDAWRSIKSNIVATLKRAIAHAKAGQVVPELQGETTRSGLEATARRAKAEPSEWRQSLH